MSTSNQKEDAVVFIGPDKVKCESFLELCACFMDTHWPGWKDSMSHLMPPVFYYKEAHKSDALLEAEVEKKRVELKKNSSAVASKNSSVPTKSVVKRLSDKAEHDVYQALDKLTKEQYKAPVIALHSFNMDSLTAILPMLTGQIDLPRLREYDFVLIGLKIGLIVIEVKSATFEQCFAQATNFEHWVRLPAGYSEGIDQLNSIDQLLSILAESFKLESLKGIPVRKILFTPNLEKDRYYGWLMILKRAVPEVYQRITEKMGEVIQWFKEDMCNLAELQDKPPLYGVLYHLMDQLNPMSEDLYTTWGALFAGLNSISITKKEGITRIFLNEDKFSVGIATKIEISRIHDHDAISKPDSSNFPSETNRKMISEITLTAEQHSVLNRQCRRLFIVGYAGVGKTVILARRALERMAAGQSVMFVTQASYVEKLKQIFDGKGKYEVKVWEDIWSHPDGGLASLIKDDGCWFGEEENSVDLYQLLVSKIELNCEKYQHVLGGLFKSDHILIDDAFNQLPLVGEWEKMMIPSLAVMAFAQVTKSNTTVWIAGDPYGYLTCLLLYDGPLHGEPVIENILQRFLSILSGANHQPILCKESLDKYCTIILPRVMRCSQHVFKTTYDAHGLRNHHVQVPRELIPELGHKIQGLPHLRIEKAADSIIDAMKLAFSCLQEQIYLLFKQGMRAVDIAVISRIQEEPFISHRQLNDCICAENTCFDCWRSHVNYHYYENVASLEWPVVITFELWPQVEKYDQYKLAFCYKFFKYFAFTRATTQIIEILVKYSIDDIAHYSQKVQLLDFITAIESPWNLQNPQPRGIGLIVFMMVRDRQVTDSAKWLCKLAVYGYYTANPSKAPTKEQLDRQSKFEDDLAAAAADEGNVSGTSTRSKWATSLTPNSKRKEKSVNLQRENNDPMETKLMSPIGGEATAKHGSSSTLASTVVNAELGSQMSSATASIQDEHYFFAQLVTTKLRRLNQSKASAVQRDVLEILRMAEMGRQWVIKENMAVDEDRNTLCAVS